MIQLWSTLNAPCVTEEHQHLTCSTEPKATWTEYPCCSDLLDIHCRLAHTNTRLAKRVRMNYGTGQEARTAARPDRQTAWLLPPGGGVGVLPPQSGMMSQRTATNKKPAQNQTNRTAPARKPYQGCRRLHQTHTPSQTAHTSITQLGLHHKR